MTIIPVLPDDTMGYVFDRLSDAHGRAVVALKTADGWDLAVMWPASAARVAVAEEDDRLAQIHSGSVVSMFFEYLEEVHSLVIKQVAAQLMEHEDQPREPADH